jgi:predicted nucleotidyltransferase
MKFNLDKVYPELPMVLEQLIMGVKEILGNNLIGVYLIGSLATGDFDLDSDIDFLVIINDELSDETVQELQNMHREIYTHDCYPAHHLEGSYMSLKILNDAESVNKTTLWYLDNGSTTFERSIHDNRWHVRWMLRENGVALFGPDPKTLVPPVPIDKMRIEIGDIMHVLEKGFMEELDQPLSFYNTRFGQSFSVLTICRMLHSIETGTIQSKLAGANWAKQALDPQWRNLIDQAWEERKGVRFCVKIRQPAERELLDKTAEFIEYGILMKDELLKNLQ